MKRLFVILLTLICLESSLFAYATVEDGKVVIRSSVTNEILAHEDQGTVDHPMLVAVNEFEPAEDIVVVDPEVVDISTVVVPDRVYAIVATSWDCLLNEERTFNHATGYFESHCSQLQTGSNLVKFYELLFNIDGDYRFMVYVEDCELNQTTIFLVKDEKC